MSFLIVRNLPSDLPDLAALYRRVAALPGGLSREPEEISDDWIDGFLGASLTRGLSLGARVGPERTLVGEIHAYRPFPRAFEHVWSDLTVVVDPRYRAGGIGSGLLNALLDEVMSDHPEVLRVELLVREGNRRAIHIYEALGFRREACFEGRLRSPDGRTEAQIEMAWQRTTRSRVFARPQSLPGIWVHAKAAAEEPRLAEKLTPLTPAVALVLEG